MIISNVEIPSDTVLDIISGRCNNVFAHLGKHSCDNGYEIRCFLPMATGVTVKSKKDGAEIAVANELHEAGFYVAQLQNNIDDYYLAVSYDGTQIDIEDVYRFGSTVSANDLYLYGEGTHEKAYEFLGAHQMSIDGVSGTRFTVWAPNALTVSVVGDFNFWNDKIHVMRKLSPSGVWEIFIPAVGEGSQYKYHLTNAQGESLPHKADPYGFYAQVPPEQASIVASNTCFDWTDNAWLQSETNPSARDKPVSIYEAHLGSWKRNNDSQYLSYQDLAHDLIEYLQYMEFTHLQLMPVSEFPFDGSWGYQPIGLFAPTSRFGAPIDFKYFVNACHGAGIAVLLDWVPGHFPTDSHGLGCFDGTPLYEHADERQGFHPDWNTFIYNYGRNEVKSFLLSNAIFWFDQYHVDGLRVDAVASMLYLDYSREEGQWLPNRYGGRENLDAIDLLRLVNTRVYKNFPNAVMIAEESTAWPGVSAPVDLGGLGFGYKWNMGWMNDSLSYMEKDPIYRKHHHHDMTFSLHYAFSENFVLPLSHDEVVHGKGSMINKMPGDRWQQFANLKAYYAFMWAHPGKKLLFMGCEFAQNKEWNHNHSICWHESDNAFNQGVQSLVAALNKLYKTTPALHQLDCDGAGFEWNEADDQHNSVFVFTRKGINTAPVIVICNFTPAVRENYCIGVNDAGNYIERLNTDSVFFNGTNLGNAGMISTQEQNWNRFSNTLTLTLPALSTIVLELEV